MNLDADGDFRRAGVRDRGIFCTAAGVELLECVEGWRVRLGGATWPCWLWTGRLQRDGDLAEQIGLRTGSGEGQTNAGDGFDDASAQLQQPESVFEKCVCHGQRLISVAVAAMMMRVSATAVSCS